MNKIVLNEYVSPRLFKLLDYRIGHQFLLIRGMKAIYGEPRNNIDIVFAIVRLLSIPVFFEGLKMTRPRNQETVEIEKKYGVQNNDGSSVFFMETKNVRHYVIASMMTIYENNLEASDSSLSYICTSDSKVKKEYLSKNVINKYQIF